MRLERDSRGCRFGVHVAGRGPPDSLPNIRAAGAIVRAKAGAPVVEVRVDAHGRLDLDAMLDRVGGSGLVYLCNPNNPTSTAHAARRRAGVHRSASMRDPLGPTVLVDEAYHDYVETPAYATAIPLATADPRVLVVTHLLEDPRHGGHAHRLCRGAAHDASAPPPMAGRSEDERARRRRGARVGGGRARTSSAQRALNREAKAFTLAALAPRWLHRVHLRREFRDGGRRPRLPFVRLRLCVAAGARGAAVSSARSPRAHHSRHAGRDAAGGCRVRRGPRRRRRMRQRDGLALTGSMTASRSADQSLGLCATCAHVRPTPSAKGTLFYRCARSSVDLRYPKYPTVPVLRCGGHEMRSPAGRR